MEVKLKYSNREVYFEDIERGEVFVYDDDAYLRLDKTYELEDEPDVNAIHLKTGELCHFCAEGVIRPIKIFPMEIVY
jgi:hypothetical protein